MIFGVIMDMHDYLDLATRVVMRYAPRYARDPEAIDSVAYAVMRSDWCGGGDRRDGVARDAVRKHLRRLASRRGMMSLDDMIIDRRMPEPAEIVMEAESEDVRRRRCMGLIASLNPRQRRCVTLHYLHGRSAEDISRTLDISTSAVYQHLRRGVDAMRRVADA